MRSSENVEKLIRNAEMHSDPEVNQMVLKDLLHQFDKTQEKKSTVMQPKIGRTIMKSPITKLAAAAVVIAAITLSVYIWDKSTPLAYAIEQTIEANNNIRYLHIKIYAADEKEPREGWLEFDRDGQVAKARIHLPAWFFPTDVARVIVWKEDMEQVWDKSKKILGIMKANKNTKEQLTAFLQDVDPRLAVKHIYELESQNIVKVEIAEPSDKTEPITMTVTYSLESSTPSQRQVLRIDPVTKLVSSIELYQLKNGEYQYEGVIELDEYNQSTNAQLFDLQNEVPSDVTHIDQTANDVGLAQGQLSDEEAAVEVVRQFLKYLIAEDYAGAGRLFFIPANQLQQQFGRVKFLRIVSIGPAIPNPELETKGYDVPCTIEIEENGKIITPTLEGIKVQQLRNQPSRWFINSLSD
ncbi:MAG: hypothetical protein ACYS3S_04195 [Planctomycetota bacterium]